MSTDKVVLGLGVLLTILNIINWVLNRYDKAKSVGAREAVTETDIGAIRQGNATILVQLDKMDSKMDNYQERLVRVEESTKQAHHRLNEHVASKGHI